MKTGLAVISTCSSNTKVTRDHSIGRRNRECEAICDVNLRKVCPHPRAAFPKRLPTRTLKLRAFALRLAKGDDLSRASRCSFTAVVRFVCLSQRLLRTVRYTVACAFVLSFLGTSCSGPSKQTTSVQRSSDGVRDSSMTSVRNAVTDSLSRAEWKKLDHALTLLLREGPDNPFFNYQTRTREDGSTTYGVLIRTSDPAALSESDLPFGNVSSKITTGQLTIDEIRRAAQLTSVVSISNPSEAELH